MKKFLRRIFPPENWRIPVIITAGIFTGLFCFSFYISNAPSYLSDNPATCVNCHVMAPQYATWVHSSHREKTHCNDCHTPNEDLFSHYFFKAKDGLRHATIFTLRAEPQVIMIKEAGQEAVQNNCLRCHDYTLSDDRLSTLGNNNLAERESRQCWTCHRETPHGRVHSLASTPFARVPLPGSPVPDWLESIMKNKPNKDQQ
ncbi:MAG: cytochrome c nitrite reductase small subunit [Bacteroidota bacterium]